MAVCEPVTLSVSDLVREIARVTGGSPAAAGGSWATALTGTLFHEVAAQLLRGEDHPGWRSVLDRDTVGDTGRLTRHVYQTLLGPKLRQHQAVLHSQTRAVLSLWIATQELCRMLTELLRAAQAQGLIRFSEQLRWEGADSLFLTETALEWVISNPSFRAPVRIRGVADAVWFHPVNRSWCVLELKTSRGSPEAELSQACLYHRMISATRPDTTERSAIALVYFRPELEVVTFTADQLRAAQSRLELLAGRLAGVLKEPDGIAAHPALPKVRPQMDGHEDLAKRVVAVLRQYGCDVSLAGPPVVGPTFLRVRLLPGRGTKVKPIQDHASSLQVQLRLESPPMIYVANGDLVVDLQRPDRQTVMFSSVRNTLPQPDRLLGNSRAMLGVDLFGQVRYVDLSDDNTAHILVAGTPGSGKSEWLRAGIASLLLTNTPDTLRLVLIDPKRTAFQDLRGSKFLWNEEALVLPPDGSVVEVLDQLIEEMERRYAVMEQYGVDKVADAALAIKQPIPRLVCVCDELADVLHMDRKYGKEIEQRVVRLAAKARAAGIHLILATQHPNRDVISGALKTTLGGRVCLRTTSHVQSALMSTPNAEKLLGRGDLLYLDIGEPVRVQAPLLPTAERRRIFAG